MDGLGFASEGENGFVPVMEGRLAFVGTWLRLVGGCERSRMQSLQIVPGDWLAVVPVSMRQMPN